MIVMFAVVASVQGSSIEARPHESSIHRAIALWLEQKPDEAMREVETHVLPPATTAMRGDADNAALRNLGARIQFARYERLRGYTATVKEAFAALEAARAHASAAVWECPYEIEYWRDFIRFNAFDPQDGAKHVEAFMARFNTASFRFKVEGQTRVLTPELRLIASAIAAEQRDDIMLAEQRLQSWVDRNGKQGCASSIVLADVQTEMDRYASAQTLLEERAKLCGGSVEQACAMKVGRIKLVSPERASRWVGGRRVSTGERDDDDVSADVDVQSSFDDVNENFFDIADRLLRDATRFDDWHRLWERAGTDERLQKRFDQLLAVVRSRPGAAHVAEIARAQAYRRIALGQFASARKDLQTLVRNSDGNADAEVVVATLLLDADEEFDAPTDADKRLLEAKRADPYLVACINEQELKKCDLRRHGCTPPAIVCTDADEFIYRAYTVGIAERPHAVRGANQFMRRTVRLNAQMIRDTEMRMLAEIQSREAGLARRISAVEQRVDIIVDIRLAQMESDIRREARNQADFQRRMETKQTTLRREVQLKMERAAAAAARAENAARASSRSSVEVARLWTQYQADVALLKASVPHMEKWTQPRDFDRLEATVLKLTAAVEELDRPRLARDVEVLGNWRNETWDKRIQALSSALNEIDTIAMALTLRGKLKLLALGPALKSLADGIADSYQQRRRKQRSGAAMP